MYGQSYPDQWRGHEPRAAGEERRAARTARRRGQAVAGIGADAAAGSDWDGAGRVYGGRAGTALAGEPASDDPSKPRQSPLWAKLMTAVGVVIVVLSGITLAGVNMAIARYAGNVQQDNLLGAAAVDPGKELEGPVNILLLGVDARPNSSDDVRSDTIIVLHIPSSHDQAYLISVPRDTWTAVPGYWEMKITEAFYHGSQDGRGWSGGTQLVAQSITELTGLEFNAAAIVNFSGFRKIIDEMGGIEFCVETSASSEHYVLVDGKRMGIAKAKREGHYYEPVRYEVGCQHLAGWQALDYVRQRKTLESGEGDYGRQKNQKLLLQAMAKQATSSDVMTNLGTLDRLLLAAGDAVVVDTNNVPLVDFLFTFRNVAANDMVSLRTNGGKFNSITVNGASAEQLTPESLEMFRAAADDDMASFVLNYPDYINQD